MLKPAILVIDDTEAKRYMIVRYLERAGFEVWQAGTASEGLELARQNPDLVVLDVNLPDQTGFDVCRKIKENPHTRNIPVLHVSATFTASVDKVQGLESGADAYMTEPVQPEEFLAQVKVLLRLKVAQDELRATNARLNSVLATITDAYFVLDGNWRVVALNAAAETFFGRRAADLTGKVIWEEFPEAKKAEFYRQYHLARREKRSVHFEAKSPISGRWHEAHAYPQPAGDLEVYLRDINERKQAEEALARTNELLEGITEAAPDLIYAKDRSGRMIFCNPATVAVIGKPLERIIGHTESEWWPENPEQARRIMENDMAVITSGQIQTREEELGLPGHTRIYQSTKAPMRNAAGEIVGLVGVTRDITDLKRTQEELARQSVLTRTITDNSTQALFMMDERGYCTFMNPAAEKMFGFTFAEIRTRPLHEMIHHHHPDGSPYPASECPIDRALPENSDIREHEEMFIRKDGDFFPVVVAASPIFDQGRPVSTVLEVRDITERKRAEATLRESEERFRMLADSSPLPIWVTGADGALLFVNEGYRRFFGKGLGEVRGSGWEPLVHPDDLPAYRSAFEKATRERQPFHVLTRVRRADGEWRWIDSRALPRLSALGEFLGMVGSSPDVTEIKEANETLEQRVSERTAKLQEAIDELEGFTYSITHDMRSPLRAMQGFSNMLLADYRKVLDQQGVEYLQRISSAASRLDHLILDVLNYGKIARAEITLRPVDLHKLVHEITLEYPEFQQPQADIQIEGGLPPVWGNEALLTQCLSNLLSNAVKFVSPDTRPCVRISAQPCGELLRIAVRDNGIGIAPEHRDRIFRMFERLHASNEFTGTGIGLTIVRKAVERLQGRVGVDSEVGKGSSFWIELRRA